MLCGTHYTGTVPFRIVRHGLWPVTTAPKFCFGRCQWDTWHWRVSAFGMLKFRPFVQPFLKFFVTYYMSRPANISVTRDNNWFRRRQEGPWPVTCRTIRNGTVSLTYWLEEIFEWLVLDLETAYSSEDSEERIPKISKKLSESYKNFEACCSSFIQAFFTIQ